MDSPGEELSAEIMELHGGEIETLQADHVQMHMGGAQKIEASEVFMQQSAAALVEATSISQIMNIGTWISGLRSGGPASSRQTVCRPSSLSRSASTQPAEPPPITT